MAFANALRSARLKGGLTQEVLAERADFKTNYVSMLETGTRQPTISALIAFERALGLDAGELVRETVAAMSEERSPVPAVPTHAAVTDSSPEVAEIEAAVAEVKAAAAKLETAHARITSSPAQERLRPQIEKFQKSLYEALRPALYASSQWKPPSNGMLTTNEDLVKRVRQMLGDEPRRRSSSVRKRSRGTEGSS